MRILTKAMGNLDLGGALQVFLCSLWLPSSRKRIDIRWTAETVVGGRLTARRSRPAKDDHPVGDVAFNFRFKYRETSCTN
jgi:hypothetical protein